MTAPRRAAILGIAGTTLTAEEAALFAETSPAGVILFRRNISDPAGTAVLVAAVRKLLPETAILIDQEGGRVARLRPPDFRAHPSAGEIGALYARDPAAGRDAAFESGLGIGTEAAGLGIDTVCAPVLDLRYPGASDVVGDRSYGAAPDTVATLGAAMAAGLRAAGIRPVLKHAPGHGRATVDTHVGLPVVTGPLDADLEPFRRCATLGWMMTAHVVFADYDSRPATLSETVIRQVIRGTIGFDGILVSDDLAMGALTGPPVARAEAAWAAGCDLAMHCSGDIETSRAILAVAPGWDGRAT